MFRRLLFLLAMLLTPFAAAASAEDAPAGLDFRKWRQLPVFDDGRLMPLDSFARSVVRELCERANPRLDPSGVLDFSDSDSASAAAVRKLFPDGKVRKFHAAELLYGWYVEPDVWEHIPFLIARHEDLREKVLGVPLRNKAGHRLKYVSPRDMADSTELETYLDDLEGRRQKARKDRTEFKYTDLDKRVEDLVGAYNLYRLLTYNPSNPGESRERFLHKLGQAAERWRFLRERLSGARLPRSDQAADELLRKVEESFMSMAQLAHPGRFTIEQADPLLVALRESTAACAEKLCRQRRAVFDDESSTEDDRRMMNETAAAAKELAQLANEMHSAVFDNAQSLKKMRSAGINSGGTLRLVPALNSAALNAQRDTTDDNQPWLSLQTVLFGSPLFLKEYPLRKIDEVRSDFAETAGIYVDRDAPDRGEKFAEAMDTFAASVRDLGEEINELRRDLPLDERDREVMLKPTCYPEQGATDAELHYTNVNPFLWAWIVYALAVLCLSLSFGILRKPMFWAGIVWLFAAQVLIIYGFALRSYITGWAPVTNMFETILFVALVVAMLGGWFTLLPLTWPGVRLAWQMGRLPRSIHRALFRWMDDYEDEEAESPLKGDKRPQWLETANWSLLLPQAAIMVFLFVVLTGGDRPILRLLPDFSRAKAVSEMLAWAVGLATLLVVVLLLPRTLLTMLLSLVTIPAALIRRKTGEAVNQAMERKVFAFSGALVGLIAAVVAYYWSALNKDIGQLMPILRDNFWLTVHVLSITASYGAAALAWWMGNVSLTYYLFGRYREKGVPNTGDPSLGETVVVRQPPEACARLGGFIYRAIQVAVLLLAAGTILGALWADVAWGRFWGWDAKEVWALISILVYMIILHGRYVNWFGNFGLAAGSVVGLTAIVMAWYGVNYVLGTGLHTYGGGTGGQLQVSIAVLLNWLYIGIAAVRYNIEIRANAPLDAPSN